MTFVWKYNSLWNDWNLDESESIHCSSGVEMEFMKTSIKGMQEESLL